jgi:hypothetical protein
VARIQGSTVVAFTVRAHRAWNALLALLGGERSARRRAADCLRSKALVEALSEVANKSLPSSALAKTVAGAVQALSQVLSLRSPLIAVACTVAWMRCLVWVSHSGAAARVAGPPGCQGRGPRVTWEQAAALATLLLVGPFVLYEFQSGSMSWKHESLGCGIGLPAGVMDGAVGWLVMRRGYLDVPAASWMVCRHRGGMRCLRCPGGILAYSGKRTCGPLAWRSGGRAWRISRPG